MIILRFTLLLTLFCTATSFAHQVYRFKVNGQTIIKDHVPAEYAKYGYQILNSQGMVVGEVAPEPTSEELAERARILAQQEELARRQKEQKQQDNTLLQLYSQPKDVKRIFNKKISDVQAQVVLQQRRRENLDEKLLAAQSRAANYERRSQSIPKEVQADIDSLERAIKRTDTSIKTRQQEERQLKQEMGEHYQRMRELQVYAIGTLSEDIDAKYVDAKLSQ